MKQERPKIIEGKLFADDRGYLSFVNDFDFKDVKRFYIVENHEKGFVRAWHGHQKEAKYVHVIKGSAVVAAVSMDCCDSFSTPDRFVLTEKIPKILYIPPGYYNGFMNLTEDTKILFYSTSTLQQSAKDDTRLDWNYIPDFWKVERR